MISFALNLILLLLLNFLVLVIQTVQFCLRMRDGLRSRTAVRLKMYEKSRAVCHMGDIYQDPGAGGGEAF